MCKEKTRQNLKIRFKLLWDMLIVTLAGVGLAALWQSAEVAEGLGWYLKIIISVAVILALSEVVKGRCGNNGML